MTDGADDYDFTPSSGFSSNLRSLFDKSSDNFENPTLTYTAPKQPKPGPITAVSSGTNDESPKLETKIVCACVVQVWKLLDGKYTPLGKHGLAIICSSTQNSSELILYKEKRDVLMRIKVNSKFIITLKNDNFASFNENSDEHWLIKFHNQNDTEIIRQNVEMYGGKVVSNIDGTSSSKKSEAFRPMQESTTISNKDEDASPFENNTRADILSRISKMGQSILPNKSLADTGAEVEKPPRTEIALHLKENFNANIPPLSGAMNVLQNTRPLQPPPNTFVMAQPMMYDPLNILVAENRINNSEVRLNLLQISDKLNSIMKLVDTGKSKPENENEVLENKVKVLESENENLVKELLALKENNEKLETKFKQQEQVFAQLEQEKLGEKDSARIIESLKYELKIHQNKNEEYSQIMKEQKDEIDELKLQMTSFQEDSKRISEIPKLEGIISTLEDKLAVFEEQSQQHSTKVLSEEEIKQKNAEFVTMIKDEMNGMFSSIMHKLGEDHENVTEIISIIAQNVKSTTMKVIQTSQQIYEM